MTSIRELHREEPEGRPSDNVFQHKKNMTKLLPLSFVSVSVPAGIKPHDEGLYILGSQERYIRKVHTFWPLSVPCLLGSQGGLTEILD